MECVRSASVTIVTLTGAIESTSDFEQITPKGIEDIDHKGYFV